MAPWLGITIVGAIIASMLGALKLAEIIFRPHPELLRKLMHVAMGLAVLSFPWLFARTWPVVLLAGLSAALLTAIKLVPRLRDGIGTVLTAVQRPTLGEICFPISVGVLILLCRGDKLLYVVPMLILALADAVAALVGITYGKIRYVTTDGLKSAEGSLAFLSIAFLSVHVPLLLFTDVGRAQTLLIAALIAILSMLVEAIAARGLDNLLIPLGAFAFLRLYEHATVHALLIRLAAATVLVIFVLCWRRRSTLDDSALIACALFGYGAAMLGGGPWLVGPILLFLVHVALWPRQGQRRGHTVYAVTSVTIAGFLWLILQAAEGGTIRFFLPYAVGFGAHLAIIGVSRIAVTPGHGPQWGKVAASTAGGWMLVMVQMIPALMRPAGAPVSEAIFVAAAGLGGVALAAVAFHQLMPRIYGPRGSAAMIHFTGFGAAFLGSLLVAGAHAALVGHFKWS